MRKKVSRKNKLIPYLLVFLQFSGIALIIYTGSFFVRGPVLFMIQISAVILGLWSVLVMKLGHFNIIPIPQEDSVLITKGPYAIIRHPMYSSILLFTLISIIEDFNTLRLIIFIGLLISLVWKLNYEERLLKIKFHQYSKYQKKSFRILPFLY